MRRFALVFAVVLFAGCSSAAPDDTSERFEPEVSDEVAATESVAQACKIDDSDIVERIWRGHHPVHSEDVTAVPAEPNFWGSFEVVSHSGPWDYLQQVPLVLYGPRIAAQGEALEQEASLVDVYPTVAELLGADLKARTGEVLTDALAEDGPGGAPKLILTIMWDGVGLNMLERWPDRWPHLARLERDGTSYRGAVVGSSPSITPATHASLGTGAYPRDHRVTAIEYRTRSGKVRGAFAQRNPRDLKLTTYADQFDKMTGNESRVGLIAWRDWHMPMLGHGSMTPGGDKDQLAIIGGDGRITGNPNFYSTPKYLKGKQGRLERYADELDRADGKADGQWRGHDILDAYEDNPAYVRFQGDMTMRMLKRGGYGADDIPDLFFANYKQTDIAGHRYTIDSDEVGDVLEEQDRQLARIIRWADKQVGDYVLVLSSDHGHTPDPRTAGAWPINPTEFKADAQRHFKVPSSDKLWESTTAVGPFLNESVADKYGVTARQVARFIEDYTLRDNWPDGEQLPKGYRNRGAEKVFSAAWAKEDMAEVVACAT